MLRAAPLTRQRLSRNAVRLFPHNISAFAISFAEESTSVRYQSTAAPEPRHEDDSSSNDRTTLQRQHSSGPESSRFPVGGPQGENRRGAFVERRWSQDGGGGLLKNHPTGSNDSSSHRLGNSANSSKTMAPFGDKMKAFFENRPKEATVRKPKPSLRSRAPSILQPHGRSRPWDLTPRTNETDSPSAPAPMTQPAASKTSVYSRQNQPPLLLDQLRQSQERHRRHKDQQKQSGLSPPPASQISRPQNNGVGLAAPGSSTRDGSSPLTQLIRTLQQKHSKENAMRNKLDRMNKNSNTDGADNTPMPLWRLQPNKNQNSLREMRRKDYQKRYGVPAAQSEFLKKGRQQKSAVARRPQKVDPKEQMVTIPSYDLSLAEVSLLFREKTTVLRNILIRLGEFPQVPQDQSPPPDEAIYIDPELMELLALELEQPFERSERESINRDEEILMQRRAASEAVVDESQDASAVPYESLPPRPPVVTVMGHVDHGKTTLMDALRRKAREAAGPSKKKMSKKDKKNAKTSNRSGDIAGTEAGGITQVISAFQVPLQGHDQVGGTVTFLDTPGHAAFRAMRESGSDAADVIVLVVAADDGVSKQTIEILEFYKSIVKESGSSGISLVVAMNKIDKPGINVDAARMRIESQLLEQGILVEGMPSEDKGEYGSPVQLFPVSALKGEGLDDLIEGLALQTEVMDLRADYNAGAEGIVLDARVDKGLGVVADCIIRWGSLEKGDIVVSGTKRGKVRLLKDVDEKQLKKATPSQPVRIIGFDSVPKAGDPIIVVKSEEDADELVERRKAIDKEEGGREKMGSEAELQSAGKHMMHQEWKAALETKYDIDSEDKNAPIRIPVIVKADADGTLAALRESLLEIGKESRHNIVIDPILSGVGPALATDIQLAKESGASIICFNLKNEQTILSLADNEKVPLLNSKVIYTLLDESKKEFAKFLPKVPVEIVHGRAKVKAVFSIGGIDEKVAGLHVIDGSLYKEQTKGENGIVKCQFRVLREGEPLSAAPLTASSLKHFKEDVEEVSRGSECGLALIGHEDYEEADVIECYSVEMKEEFI